MRLVEATGSGLVRDKLSTVCRPPAQQALAGRVALTYAGGKGCGHTLTATGTKRHLSTITERALLRPELASSLPVIICPRRPIIGVYSRFQGS